ncbi:hypothetical protein [Agrococcus casei]|uniref:Lipoprotein n=1 Tax=Agrococcus casei LMG 22410 TaxID=1255656 RepID=A0A1R4FJ74_9MICO|nr:hypothetical protein [Agrococcus casei]SJM55919.1 hypothetical protein CZ674_04770 [Agrococcus casei LMG 22410]
MNRRTRTSTRWITASALALALPLLAACSGDTDPTQSPSETTPPSESATATPSETERDPLTPPTFESPESEEQAAEDAKEAAVAFNEAHVPIEQARDSQALRQYLGDEALIEWQGQLDNIIEFDVTIEGKITFTPNDAVTVSSSKGNSEFGLATVSGCVDLSEYIFQGPDQDPLEWPNDGKRPYLYDLAYQGDTGIWKILSSYEMEGTC